MKASGTGKVKPGAADGETMSAKEPKKVWQMESVAEGYLREVSEAIPERARQIEVMLRLLEGLGRPVRRFLDLGCGDGILAGAVCRRYPEASAVLVDFSEPMLEAARRRFDKARPAPKLVKADLARNNALKGLAGEGPFDAVISGFAIHHLKDARKRELYGEIFGLLAEGGIFINHEHVASHSPWIEGIWDELMVDRLTKYRNASGEKIGREQVAAEYAAREDKKANILAHVELQCAWLSEVGFLDVDCYFKLFEIALFGGRRPEG
jgi:tRNA (cmo5U34)-methyltransferase